MTSRASASDGQTWKRSSQTKDYHMANNSLEAFIEGLRSTWGHMSTELADRSRAHLPIFTIGVLALSTAVGCAAPIYPGGALYTNTRRPDPLTRIEGQGMDKVGKKAGKACSTGILGLFAWGDASLDAAKKSAGITDVHAVDHETHVVLLGAYFEACTVISGS